MVRPVFALAFPVALSSQLDTLAGLADVFLVRDLGADAISAVGVSQIVTMVVGVVMISVSTGAFTMVAQATGAGSPVEASATTKQAFAIGITLLYIAISLSDMGIIANRKFPWVTRALFRHCRLQYRDLWPVRFLPFLLASALSHPLLKNTYKHP